MNERKIIVVMGGPSSEAEVSRRSGNAVLSALRSKGYDAEGLEFVPGNFCTDIQRLSPDIVFNAMHGAYGEDGRVQAALELLHRFGCLGVGIDDGQGGGKACDAGSGHFHAKGPFLPSFGASRTADAAFAGDTDSFGGQGDGARIKHWRRHCP